MSLGTDTAVIKDRSDYNQKNVITNFIDEEERIENCV